ncbi:helix-turn-helix domain-containing protein [Caldinitratiruptor microaerophilus]|uniref:HTH cro/C1-type domain-containing protein n=1 Tax=Caldinitratiruptor microaerophilus TaxID=671077 RepID=A0AA35CQY6_9FIRM|nr:helix-turn-helix transcriptional regulator [Caldinitratiruptor microaerophilus]BDG62185.1 hypothetical protein caldi_32750 [Caldinitratiruptor microaerophilus]
MQDGPHGSSIEEETTWRRIGQRLRAVREQLNKTQDAVAEYLGVTRPVVSNLENGKRPVSLAELMRLAMLYGYPVQYFLGNDGSAEDGVVALFRSRDLTDTDREKLAWLHGFLEDYLFIRRLWGGESG